MRNEAGTGVLSGIVEIAATSFMTCARNAAGRTVCWGSGAPLPRVVQTSDTDATPATFTSFLGQGNASGDRAFGRTPAGVRVTWPRLVGTSTIFVAVRDTSIVGTLLDVGGSSGTFGESNLLECLLHDPGLQCMGFNTYGEVGNGTRSLVPAPPATVLAP